MIMDIHSQPFKAGRLAKNDLHRAHGFLAGFDVLFCSAILGALRVVGFDLPDLLLIQQHLGDARMILDGNRDAVGHRLIHRIPVNLVAEGLVGLGDGGSRKANKGRIREGFLQYLGIGLGHHRLHVLVGVLAELNFSGMLQLGSVRLVRKADDVDSVVD